MTNVAGFLGSVEVGNYDENFIDGLDSVDDLLDVVAGLGAIATNRNVSAAARTAAVKGQAKAGAKAKAKSKTAPKGVRGAENENKNTSLKTLMENRVGDIKDNAVKESLIDGNLTVVDGEIYSAKKAIADTKLMEPKDARKIGVRSINKAQLDNGTVMIVTHIAIESGITSGTSTVEDDDALDVQYKAVSNSTDKTLLLAEFNLFQNRKPLQVNVPIASFLYNQTSEPEGFMRLERPFIIQNSEDIDCRVTAPDGKSYAAGTYLRVRFKGGITVPRGWTIK